MNPGCFRLLLAFVVVVHHSFPLRLGSWAVGLFFVLSGYWVARMWRTKYSALPRPYASFVVSRWWRLMPLFLGVQLLAVACVKLGFPTGNTAAVGDVGWWASQPLIAGAAQFNRLLPPTWSLDVEMQFYLLAPVLVSGLAVLQGVRACWLVLGLAAWGAVRLSEGASLETPHLDVFLWLFLAGMLADARECRPTRRLVIGSGVAFLAAVALLLAVPETREWVWRRGEGGPGNSESGSEWVFFALTLIGLPIALATVHRASGKWDRWLGDLSYPLYLFHWIPRDWYYANVDWARSGLWNGGLLLTSFAMSFAGAIVLLHLLDRPAQKFRAGWSLRKRPENSDTPRENATSC